MNETYVPAISRERSNACATRRERWWTCCMPARPSLQGAGCSRPGAASAPRRSLARAARRRGSRPSTSPRTRSPKRDEGSTGRTGQPGTLAGRHLRPASRRRVVRPRLRLLRAGAPLAASRRWRCSASARLGGTITVIEGDHGSTFIHPDSAAASAAIESQVDLHRGRQQAVRPGGRAPAVQPADQDLHHARRAGGGRLRRGHGTGVLVLAGHHAHREPHQAVAPRPADLQREGRLASRQLQDLHPTAWSPSTRTASRSAWCSKRRRPSTRRA